MERYQFNANYNDSSDARVIDISAGYGHSDGDVHLGFPESHLQDLGEANGYLTLFPLDTLIFTVGTGGRFENGDASSFESEKERNVYHFLGQFDWELFPQVNLVAGGHHEEFNDMGSTTNPRVTVGYSPRNFHFRAGYGQGFRARRHCIMKCIAISYGG